MFGIIVVNEGLKTLPLAPVSKWSFLNPKSSPPTTVNSLSAAWVVPRPVAISISASVVLRITASEQTRCWCVTYRVESDAPKYSMRQEIHESWNAGLDGAVRTYAPLAADLANHYHYDAFKYQSTSSACRETCSLRH